MRKTRKRGGSDGYNLNRMNHIFRTGLLAGTRRALRFWRTCDKKNLDAGTDDANFCHQTEHYYHHDYLKMLRGITDTDLHMDWNPIEWSEVNKPKYIKHRENYMYINRKSEKKPRVNDAFDPE